MYKPRWGGSGSGAGGWRWGGRPGKWQLGVVVECPTTQNIIGNVKMVQRKELGEGNTRIRHVKLYLSSLTDNETSAPPSSPDSDLLRLNASVSTSNNNIWSPYSLCDWGTLHHYVDTASANSLALKRQPCGCMKDSVAGDEKAGEDRGQGWLYALVRGITGNLVEISRWYTMLTREAPLT